MQYTNNTLSTAIKGLVIGGTMLVPGVSGGSMAMILGIYNRLVSSISSFTKNMKENLTFLIVFVLAAGLGMLAFARPLLTLIEEYPKPMLFGILGAVAGGLPMIYKEAKVSAFSSKQCVYVLIGLCIVVAFGFIPNDYFTPANNSGFLNIFFLFTAGFIAAIALVLPGISVSYLLLLLGLYDKTMNAISHLDLLFLIPLALGVFFGILVVTKALEKAMSEYPQPTYLIIIGFILGSMATAFPGKPDGLQWIVCLSAAVLGFLLIYKVNSITN